MILRFVLPLILILGLVVEINSLAQSKKYFVEFTDKQNSPYSLTRPAEFLSGRALNRRVKQNIVLSARDLPVNPAYIAAVQQTGARIWYSSRWMNGVLIEADDMALGRVSALPFVKPLDTGSRVTNEGLSNTGNAQKSQAARQTTIDYGNSLRQNAMLGIDRMHAAGFTGQGVHIAVMDGGFFSANTMGVFGKLFASQQVLGTYDFVRKQTNVYDKSRHGTQVWSALAGYQPGALVGPAYGASYWLLRTEDEASEYRVEEVNWLIAAEFADSAGVDIINTSLGYTDFDDRTMDYRPTDMDGKTAFITRAARLAAATGMLVVVSAGNEGNRSWRTLSAPADADSVLAVAAVNQFRERATLSSSGRILRSGTIKPNLAAQGVGTVVFNPPNNVGAESGTSLSAPLVAGLAAGLWQAFPELTNQQLLGYLQRSGSQAAAPDTLLGYGIPEFSKAYDLIQKELGPAAPLGYIYPNPLVHNEISFRLKQSELGKPLHFEFFDTQGRLLYQHTVSNPLSEIRLSLSPGLFKPGLYLLKVTNPGTQVTLRVVKL